MCHTICTRVWCGLLYCGGFVRLFVHSYYPLEHIRQDHFIGIKVYGMNIWNNVKVNDIDKIDGYVHNKARQKHKLCAYILGEQNCPRPGLWFSINMPSYQYRIVG